jgi:hypothetical protein
MAFLMHGPRDTGTCHQTLWNTMDWSHRLLIEEGKRLFRRLSVFAETWSLDIARTVCDVEDAAAGLEALPEFLRRSGNQWHTAWTLDVLASVAFDNFTLPGYNTAQIVKEIQGVSLHRPQSDVESVPHGVFCGLALS